MENLGCRRFFRCQRRHGWHVKSSLGPHGTDPGTYRATRLQRKPENLFSFQETPRTAGTRWQQCSRSTCEGSGKQIHIEQTDRQTDRQTHTHTHTHTREGGRARVRTLARSHLSSGANFFGPSALQGKIAVICFRHRPVKTNTISPTNLPLKLRVEDRQRLELLSWKPRWGSLQSEKLRSKPRGNQHLKCAWIPSKLVAVNIAGGRTEEQELGFGRERTGFNAEAWADRSRDKIQGTKLGFFTHHGGHGSPSRQAAKWPKVGSTAVELVGVHSSFLRVKNCVLTVRRAGHFGEHALAPLQPKKISSSTKTKCCRKWNIDANWRLLTHDWPRPSTNAPFRY